MAECFYKFIYILIFAFKVKGEYGPKVNFRVFNGFALLKSFAHGASLSFLLWIRRSRQSVLRASVLIREL
jgi:hypothetical protein